MSTKTDIEKATIRTARAEDNEGLLALTSQTHMDGRIALRIDRQPYFFSLLRQRGESTTLVYEFEGGIIGSVSVTRSKVFVNGEINNLYYLSDLKIAGEHQGNRLALALTRELKQYLLSIDADLLFMVVADGNDKMRPYTTGIADLPAFKSTGTFNVFQFFPSKKFSKPQGYSIERITLDEYGVQIMNTFYSNYQFGKVLNSDNDSMFIALKENDSIRAMISLADMSSYKQNVVMEVSGWLEGLLYLSKWTSFINLPKLGEPVRTLYINNFYYQEADKDLITVLIDWAQKYCWDKQAHFLSFGIHERDPLADLLDSKFKITFLSHGYVASLNGNQELVNQISSGLVYEDYSLV